ncbi:hypothetical protein [Corynebacterium terpenotabidum]|uniref:Uncharacterized protein n=1 Tax=Corynebacterium terpenotabidum Y-11 TaxID=1200352 RepID=S4XAF5_9CORY|nr:hypothetical protein [Corynebacterium terpenotabidum]AGP30127.1 hypothetical protein A606_02370 [Corynebacterium terpenotabidum Y-11]
MTTTAPDLITLVQEHHHLTPPDAGAYALTAEVLRRGWGVPDGVDPGIVREAVVICRSLQEDMGDPDVDLTESDVNQRLIRSFLLSWRGQLDTGAVVDYRDLAPEDRVVMAQIGPPDAGAQPEDLYHLAVSGRYREILVNGEGRVLVEYPGGPVRFVSEPMWPCITGDVRQALLDDRGRLERILEVLQRVDGEGWTAEGLEDCLNHWLSRDFTYSRPVRTPLRGVL